MSELEISDTICIPDEEIEFQALRAQGPGGQHVNKVSSALQLRFDIGRSSLPEPVKERLTALADRRISADGVLVIKAQRHRSQSRNREDALERLQALVRAACHRDPPRRATRPTRASKQRRLDSKTRRSRIKSLRRSVDEH